MRKMPSVRYRPFSPALSQRISPHEMKKLIRDGNQPLQDIIDATRKILKSGIVPDLQVESALVKRYYDNFMLAPDNPKEPVAMALAEGSQSRNVGPH